MGDCFDLVHYQVCNSQESLAFVQFLIFKFLILSVRQVRMAVFVGALMSVLLYAEIIQLKEEVEGRFYSSQGWSTMI